MDAIVATSAEAVVRDCKRTKKALASPRSKGKVSEMSTWSELPGRPGVVMGDEAHDLANEFLADLKALYKKKAGRAPNVQEVALLLRVALRVNGRKLLELDTTRVIDVVVETEETPKDAALRAGHYIAIPIGAELFGLGRVVALKPLPLVELYDTPVTAPRFQADLVTQDHVLTYVFGATPEVDAGIWLLIDGPSKAVDASRLKRLEFYGRDVLRPRFVVNDHEGKFVREATDEDKRDLPREGARGTDASERALVEGMKARGTLPEGAYDAWLARVAMREGDRRKPAARSRPKAKA